LRLLKKAGAEVQIIGTENSLNFVGKATWESLSGKMPLFSSWETPDSSKITHIMLAQKVDCIVIAPATANIIAKAANGIADDLLSTVLCAASVPVIFAPAMNSEMFLNPATERNIKFLQEKKGVHFVATTSGELACSDEGNGRMAEPDEIFAHIKQVVMPKKETRFSWLVTGGASREFVDPVRYLTNGSTGKMGMAIASAASLMGQDVTFIGGNTQEPKNVFYKFEQTVSAEEMYCAVESHIKTADILIMSAAVADYTLPKHLNKLKKGDGELSLNLSRTKDILFLTKTMMSKDKVRVGFAAETENLIENARKKLEKKELDMVVANLVEPDFNPFGSSKNRVVFVFKDSVEELPEMDKSEIGTLIAEKAYQLANKKRNNNEQ